MPAKNPTPSQALAAREATPSNLIATYRDDFALVLPKHIDPDAFVRVAQGALRRDANLAKAASNDPGSLMSALLEAARLGLEPGTDEYYLTPRSGRILGITGWKGEVELIYRAGAVAAIKAEVVYEHDTFVIDPEADIPHHTFDPFAADRGAIRGAYAYARMKDGSYSRVAYVGPQQIKEAESASGTANSSHSPWKTHRAQMILKTAVHRLADWVPTSAEFRREQLIAIAEADKVRQQRQIPTSVEVVLPPVPAGVDAETGEVVDDTYDPELDADVVDADVVE